jgi:small subunit ribosomal protein S21
MRWAVIDVPQSTTAGVLEEGLVIVQIFVRDNNVDQALKALKKKMQREGTFREMKRHVHYEKPSEKRARQAAEAGAPGAQAGPQAHAARRPAAPAKPRVARRSVRAAPRGAAFSLERPFS